MTVKFKPDAIRNALAELKSAKVQSELGDMVVKEMRASLDVGVSPVRGERRFEKYKDVKKYPAGKKPNLPVNLRLTGEMLDALTHWVSGGNLTVGIRDSEQAKKAKAHNDGISPQPRRHFMPTDKGDELNVTITKKIQDLFARIISKRR